MFTRNKGAVAVFSLSKFAATFIMLLWCSASIHEWFHLTATQMLGGNGYIVRSLFHGGGSVKFTVVPSDPTLVAFAGGLGVALVFGILMLLDWIAFDTSGAAAILPIVLSQLGYGIVEGLFFFNMTRSQFNDISLPVMVICYGVGLVISLVWVVRDVVNRYYA